MIPLKDQEILREKFAQELTGPVRIDFFTQRELGIYVPGRQPCATCKPTGEMLQELAALNEKISLRTHIWEEARQEAAQHGVDKIPAIVLRSGRDGRRLKFYGLPGGHEFPAFVETIVDISRGTSLLSEGSKRKLRRIKERLRLQVFVTPTCPYCPQMARGAYQMALESPHIEVEVVEVNEFPELAQRYRVRAVPLTVIADKVAIPGAVPETVLVEQILKVAQGSGLAEPGEEAGPTTPAPPQEGSAPGPGSSGLIIPRWPQAPSTGSGQALRQG